MTVLDTFDVKVARTVPGTPQAVWDALTDIARFPRIFCTEATETAGRVIRAEIDARPGGRWRLDEDRSGEFAPHWGHYTALDRPRRIAFEFQVSENETPSPVVIALAKSKGGTRVTLTNEVGAEWRDWEPRIKQGWGTMLDNLQQLMVEAPRTLTLSRAFPCPVSALWAAWTDPARLPDWWGPRGFRCETKEMLLGPGGLWRFDMIGPDGTRYPNRHRYTRVEPETRIDYRLDDDGKGEHAFEASVRFHAEGEGSRLTLVMVTEDAAHRDMMVEFGAIALGYTTLDCLAEAALAPQTLSLTRLFDAPPERVWKAWTEPEALAQWFVPKAMTVAETSFLPKHGAAWRSVLVAADGTPHPVRGRFDTVEPPGRLAFSHGWEDATGAVPVETRVTVSIVPHEAGSRLTLLQEGLASPTSRDGHFEGWSETLDSLAAHLG